MQRCRVTTSQLLSSQLTTISGDLHIAWWRQSWTMTAGLQSTALPDSVSILQSAMLISVASRWQ